MTTINNTASTPNSQPNPEPEIDDELANNELFQQFLAREGQAAELNDDTPLDDTIQDGTEDGDQSGSPAGTPVPATEPDAGSVGEGSVAPSASPTDASPYLIDGVEYTPQEMQQLIGAARWAGQLNPLQAAFIDGVLAGDIQVDPTAIPGMPGYTQPGQTPQTTPQPVDDDYEYADPRLKAELDELRQQVASFSQSQAQIAQQQQLTQRAQVEAQINEGVTQFQARFGMSDADRDELLNSTVLAQIVPNFATNAPPDVAIQQAMEMLYWNTPKFRDQHIQQQNLQGQNTDAIEGSAPVVQQADRQQGQQEVRQRKMSALASSGGSVPRVAPPTKLTKQERQAAMASEVAAAMNGSQG